MMFDDFHLLVVANSYSSKLVMIDSEKHKKKLGCFFSPSGTWTITWQKENIDREHHETGHNFLRDNLYQAPAELSKVLLLP